MKTLLERVNDEVIDYDADGETLYFAIVETSDNTKQLLKELGVENPEKYVREFGEMIYETNTEFDISIAVWDSGLSEWFEKGAFIPKEENQ